MTDRSKHTPSKYFNKVDYGKNALERMQQKEAVGDIVDSILDGEYAFAQELINENLFERVDKFVRPGLKKGGKRMQNSIFGQ